MPGNLKSYVSLAKRLNQALRRRVDRSVRTRREVERMGMSPHRSVQLVASALKSVLDAEFSESDLRGYADIEGQRGRLLGSEDLLPIWNPGGTPERELAVSLVCKQASKHPEWLRLIHQIVSRLNPDVAVELGTSLGVSTAYLAQAVASPNSGRVLTFEGSPYCVAVARDLLARLGLADVVEAAEGAFKDTLEERIERMSRVQFAFVDADHAERPTLRHHGLLMRHAEDGTILIYDDIAWSRGMQAAWQKIASDARLCAVIDMGTVGICCVGPGVQEHYALSLR